MSDGLGDRVRLFFPLAHDSADVTIAVSQPCPSYGQPGLSRADTRFPQNTPVTFCLFRRYDIRNEGTD
jgi:hypothetical protein